MGWNHTPYVYVLFVGSLVALLGAGYAWWRGVHDSRALTVFKAALFVWLVGYGFEIAVPNLGSKVLWAKVQYIGIVTVPVAWFVFAAVYTGKERWIQRRTVALLAGLPLVTLILTWTNEAHGLVWSDTAIGPSGLFLALEYGPWFYVNVAYSYLMVLLGAGLIVSSVSRSIDLYRRQSLALLVAAMLPLFGNALYVLDLGPLPDLDWTPFAFLFSSAIFFVALFRYRLLDVVPVARDAIIEGLSDGVVVIDLQHRIVDLNPAAQHILGLSPEGTVGKNVLQSMSGVTGFPADYHERRALGEVEVGDGNEQRCYEMELLPLESSRDNRAGYLMTLHDITERRRSEKEVRKLNEDLEQRVSERTSQLESLVAELKESERNVRRSEKRFRSLVQNASDIITVLEADGTISYESPSVERVLEYKPEDLVNENAFEYIHPEDRGRVRKFFVESLQSGDAEPRPTEFRFRHADGTWRYLEAIGANLTQDPGVGGVVINSRDITGRKQTEDNLRQSLEMLLAVYRTGQILNSTLEPEEVGTRVLEIMQRVANLTSAVISRKNEDGELRVWRSVDIEDLWAKARFSEEAENARSGAFESQRYQAFRLRNPDSKKVLNGLCLPLSTRDRIIGILEVYGTEDLTRQETLGILSSLSAQTAGAMENARLYQDLTERERRMRDLVGELISVQEEERKRVAYEIHDGLAQVAVAAHQQLQVFADDHPPGTVLENGELDRALQLAQRTVGEARQVIADLRPTALDDFGLATALRLYAEELTSGGWPVDFEENLDEERLDAAVETALYRVAQESLTNARKHSHSSSASVGLELLPQKTRLRVRDWGCGFDPGAVSNENGPGERVGLSSMEERISLLGGKLEIQSRPGEGTTVTAEVPFCNAGESR